MCGRYVVKNPVSKTNKLVKTAIQVEETENYNAHPYQKLPVIKKYKNGNTLESLKWGLVPSWAKDKDFKALINARLETIDEKVSFKKLIKDYRCIAVAEGYYEWKREEKEKIPHYFSREDKKPIFFAGIYESDKFCLVTEEASENIKEIHHRQPVILNETDVNRYLNLELSGSSFLKECKKPNLVFHEISKDVNRPTNNTASLIQNLSN
ncbi:SOS response-associated peptidase [Candidatus Pelagibacter sp.]|jgi:putative SOS response-associated peptidase YedK|nr:SOS response-associated peptidase [Candidatus Pelagibacter sp.]